MNRKKSALLTSTAPAPKVQNLADDDRLLSKAEVLDKVGLSFPTLWGRMRDGTFPRARDLGGKSCWLESEVSAWIAALPVRRYKGDGDAAA